MIFFLLAIRPAFLVQKLYTVFQAPAGHLECTTNKACTGTGKVQNKV